MSAEEFMELKVRVPKKVVDFVREQLLNGKDEGEYWAKAILLAVGADVDQDGYLFERKDVLKRYGLEDFFFDC